MAPERPEVHLDEIEKVPVISGTGTSLGQPIPLTLPQPFRQLIQQQTGEDPGETLTLNVPGPRTTLKKVMEELTTQYPQLTPYHLAIQITYDVFI